MRLLILSWKLKKYWKRNIASVFTQEMTAAGGVRAVAEMLNRVDRAAEKSNYGETGRNKSGFGR